MNRTIASLLTGALSRPLSGQSPAAVQGARRGRRTHRSPPTNRESRPIRILRQRFSESTVSGKNGQAATAGQLQAGSTVQAELTNQSTPASASGAMKSWQDHAGREVQRQTVLPKGSKIVGHVTDVQAREKGQQESHMRSPSIEAILKNAPSFDGAHPAGYRSSQASASGSHDIRR